jgi:hypothetical protein
MGDLKALCKAFLQNPALINLRQYWCLLPPPVLSNAVKAVEIDSFRRDLNFS